MVVYFESWKFMQQPPNAGEPLVKPGTFNTLAPSPLAEMLYWLKFQVSLSVCCEVYRPPVATTLAPPSSANFFDNFRSLATRLTSSTWVLKMTAVNLLPL